MGFQERIDRTRPGALAEKSAAGGSGTENERRKRSSGVAPPGVKSADDDRTCRTLPQSAGDVDEHRDIVQLCQEE